nr:MAG TPA: hypothetical protein [Caudoviricetes sp.]
MLTIHDALFLHRLKKIGQKRNLFRIFIEPFDGVTGSAYLDLGNTDSIRFTGKDYFSFMALVDQGYLVLSQPEDNLYQFTYKAIQHTERTITDFLGLLFMNFLAPVAVAIITALLVAA